MSCVFFNFVEFARNVVVEVEQSAVEVLRAVDQRLILAGPRFDVNDRDARVERPKVLRLHSINNNNNKITIV